MWIPATFQNQLFVLHTHTHKQGTAATMYQKLPFVTALCFPAGSDGKASACNAGDPGSIPGSGRSPGEGNGNPLQYSCLENPVDRGSW